MGIGDSDFCHANRMTFITLLPQIWNGSGFGWNLTGLELLFCAATCSTASGQHFIITVLVTAAGAALAAGAKF